MYESANPLIKSSLLFISNFLGGVLSKEPKNLIEVLKIIKLEKTKI